MEFAAGLASVQNPFQALQDSWDAAAPDGDSLVFGAMAGQGTVVNEGEILALARLDALAGVLAEATPLDQPRFELLDAIHPDLPANGLDGAIVYATLKPAFGPVVTGPVATGPGVKDPVVPAPRRPPSRRSPSSARPFSC